MRRGSDSWEEEGVQGLGRRRTGPQQGTEAKARHPHRGTPSPGWWQPDWEDGDREQLWPRTVFVNSHQVCVQLWLPQDPGVVSVALAIQLPPWARARPACIYAPPGPHAVTYTDSRDAPLDAQV